MQLHNNISRRRPRPLWALMPGMKKIRRFNFRLIARLSGTLLTVMGASMVLPIVVSWYCRDGEQFDLIFSAVLMLAAGLFFRNVLGRNAEYDLHEKESFWVTALSWIVVPMVGSFPYLITGVAPTFVDAVFESFSGFTTTGSTILRHLDSQPQGILVWRALTQWIGGLGLIMFVIALFRKLDIGSWHLYDAEFSGTVQRKLHPRISTSVTYMWFVYSGLTIALIVLLLFSGNDPLTSLCLSLSTVSTGGFMISDAGLSSLSTLSLFWVALFMFLGGVNIALLYQLLIGKARALWRSEEFRVFAILLMVAFLSCSVAFICKGNPWSQSLGYSAFHIVSTLSSCGFCLRSPARWPLWVSAVTFVIMILGAMSGSTGGGIKLKRAIILTRYVRNYFTRMIHPNVVFTVRIDSQIIADEYINKIFAFVFLYLFFILGGGFLLTLCGLSIPQAVCMSAANISNLGPTPLVNNMGANIQYADLVPLAKWTLVSLMLVGRVEIFAILSIFSPSYWRR